MMYPIDKCYFCDDELDSTSQYKHKCINNFCCLKHKYSYFPKDQIISFEINDYLFEMRFVGFHAEKDEMVIWKYDNHVITVPMMLVTEDNYLDVINRFEKLSVFK